jgi:hypothetical protein
MLASKGEKKEEILKKIFSLTYLEGMNGFGVH